MIFSVTERAEFKRCRRKWSYSSFNRQHITRIVPKRALSLGTLVHKALATWLDIPTGNLANIFTRYAAESLDEARASYRKNIGAEISDAELDPLYEAIHTGVKMMQNYQERYHTPLPDNFRLLSPEQTVLVPIPGTQHQLEGRFDALIEDEHGRIHILEHKTYSQRPRQDHLQMNDQFLGYLWILKQAFGQNGGLAYDGMWTRTTPPKNGTEEDLFTRVILYRPDVELEEFETFLRYEVAEMANPDTPLYINRNWMGCFDCMYDPLCTAQSRGEDTEYVRSTMFTIRERTDDDDD